MAPQLWLTHDGAVETLCSGLCEYGDTFPNGSYRQLTSYELRYGPAQAVLEVLFGAVQAVWKRWIFWGTWIAELVGPSEWIDSGILENSKELALRLGIRQRAAPYLQS